MTVDNKTFLAGMGILGLVILESIAMLTGNDGAYFSIIVTGIGALAGYSLAQQSAIATLAKATLNSSQLGAIQVTANQQQQAIPRAS